MLVVAGLSCLLSGCIGHDGHTPTAQQGVIDLSGSDEVLTASSIDLDGEWAFHWQQLLTPEDFRGPQPPAPSGYLHLPGAWNGLDVGGTHIDGEGYATFHLRVLTGPASGGLALHLGTIESAYRLWANGMLVAENGVIGTNTAAETPAQSSRLVRLPPDRPLELVLQVSNYHYREGGVLSPIELGTPERMESAQLRKWATVSLCIGAIAVMGLYHLVFFAFRRNNMATLYFGVYCLLGQVIS